MLTKLLQKGDEVGYISTSDDQSFGMFCPIFQVRDEELASMFVAGWNSHAEEAEVLQTPLSSMMALNAWQSMATGLCLRFPTSVEDARCQIDARAIEAEVRAEAQEPVANIALRIAAKYATGGEGVRLAKDICEALKGSASQPPAPCPVCANLRETNRELSSKYDALQAERIAELESKPAARYLNTNAHLESVIAEQAALIEKCEKALNVVTVMPKSHESVRLAVQTLAAIAAHRSQP